MEGEAPYWVVGIMIFIILPVILFATADFFEVNQSVKEYNSFSELINQTNTNIGNSAGELNEPSVLQSAIQFLFSSLGIGAYAPTFNNNVGFWAGVGIFILNTINTILLGLPELIYNVIIYFLKAIDILINGFGIASWLAWSLAALWLTIPTIGLLRGIYAIVDLIPFT